MKSIFVKVPTLLITIASLGISFNTNATTNINATSIDLDFRDTFDYGSGSVASYHTKARSSVSEGAGGLFGYARAESQWGTTKGLEFVSAQAQSLFNFFSESNGYATMYGLAETSLVYYIHVSAIDSSLEVPTEVPLLIDWTIFANSRTIHENLRSRPFATSIAEVYFTTGGDVRHHRVATGDGSVSDSGRDSIMMQGGQIRVGLSASVQTRVANDAMYGSGSNSAWGTAYADPIITIDPIWEFADQYTLDYTLPEFELESVSVSTVPVPASVWLFGSGLISLIGFARGKTA